MRNIELKHQIPTDKGVKEGESCDAVVASVDVRTDKQDILCGVLVAEQKSLQLVTV